MCTLTQRSCWAARGFTCKCPFPAQLTGVMMLQSIELNVKDWMCLSAITTQTWRGISGVMCTPQWGQIGTRRSSFMARDPPMYQLVRSQHAGRRKARNCIVFTCARQTSPQCKPRESSFHCFDLRKFPVPPAHEMVCDIIIRSLGDCIPSVCQPFLYQASL